MLLKGSLKLVIVPWFTYVLVENPDSPSLASMNLKFSFKLLRAQSFGVYQSSILVSLALLFEIGCGIYALTGLDYDSPPYASYISGMIGV
jgi:hypothetical protein